MELVYQYMIIFFTFSPTLNHFHPLQVENCDSNYRLVVDEDDNVKSGLKGLNRKLFPHIFMLLLVEIYCYKLWHVKQDQPHRVVHSQCKVPDRQTDRYFIDRNKSHYRLICHSNKRDICTCIYKNVRLLKSCESIYIVW